MPTRPIGFHGTAEPDAAAPNDPPAERSISLLHSRRSSGMVRLRLIRSEDGSPAELCTFDLFPDELLGLANCALNVNADLHGVTLDP